VKRLGLCARRHGRAFRTTTEVYTGQPRTSPEELQCGAGQPRSARRSSSRGAGARAVIESAGEEPRHHPPQALSNSTSGRSDGWNSRSTKNVAGHFSRRLADIQQGPGRVVHRQFRVEPLFRAKEPSGNAPGVRDNSTPGARSAWHIAPGRAAPDRTHGWEFTRMGVLSCNSVRATWWVSPGVKHWHGAALALTAMTHIALDGNDGRPRTRNGWRK